jgi:hypothetical protein
MLYNSSESSIRHFLISANSFYKWITLEPTKININLLMEDGGAENEPELFFF